MFDVDLVHTDNTFLTAAMIETGSSVCWR